MISIVIGAFFVFLVMGIPITFVLGLTATLAFLIRQDLIFLSLIPQRMFSGLSIFTIMAIPFFFLAAELMSKSRITDDLVRFADALVGRLKGGLAQVNILASAFFAGISGSAIADVAGLGSIEIKAMTKAGYPKPFSAALTVASSLIGPMIPPSIIMVLYGSIMQVSIAAMFLGGLLPGLLLALMLMAMVHFMADRHGFPRREEKLSRQEFMQATRNALLALFMPGIILGGILGGIFTPTEAAAVAVLYAFLIGTFVKRTLRLADLAPILLKVAVMTSVVFMVLATANILAWIIGLERLPEAIAKGLLHITENPVSPVASGQWAADPGRHVHGHRCRCHRSGAHPWAGDGFPRCRSGSFWHRHVLKPCDRPVDPSGRPLPVRGRQRHRLAHRNDLARDAALLQSAGRISAGRHLFPGADTLVAAPVWLHIGCCRRRPAGLAAAALPLCARWRHLAGGRPGGVA